MSLQDISALYAIGALFVSGGLGMMTESTSMSILSLGIFTLLFVIASLIARITF